MGGVWKGACNKVLSSARHLATRSDRAGAARTFPTRSARLPYISSSQRSRMRLIRTSLAAGPRAQPRTSHALV
jgi:hypothetical protein